MEINRIFIRSNLSDIILYGLVLTRQVKLALSLIIKSFNSILRYTISIFHISINIVIILCISVSSYNKKFIDDLLHIQHIFKISV